MRRTTRPCSRWGVSGATQLNDIRTLFKKEEIPKIVEGITAYLSKEVVDPKPVLVEQGNAMALIQQRTASAIDDEKARGAEAVAAAAAVEGAEQTKSGQ